MALILIKMLKIKLYLSLTEVKIIFGQSNIFNFLDEMKCSFFFLYVPIGIIFEIKHLFSQTHAPSFSNIETYQDNIL